jgi:hypothetical protein
MDFIHENPDNHNEIAPRDSGVPATFYPPPLVKPNLSEALVLAKAGARVFPLYPIQFAPAEDRYVCTKGSKGCKAIGKHPKIKGWIENASNDPKQVADWWSCSQPGSEIGIGLAMGGNFFCLDIDGPEGEESLARLIAKHEPLADTLEASTGRKDKGRHLLFRKPPDRKVVSRRYDNGLDVKGEGSFVVATPTLHRSGARYQWAKIVPIAKAPDWLLNELDSPVRQNKSTRVKGSSTNSGILSPPFPTWDSAAEADLDNLLAHIDGSARDNWLAVGMTIAHWTLILALVTHCARSLMIGRSAGPKSLTRRTKKTNGVIGSGECRRERKRESRLRTSARSCAWRAAARNAQSR